VLHRQPLATPVVEKVVDARCETQQKLRKHVVHVAADLGDVRGVDERAPDRIPDEAVVRIEGDAG
jgi:predicted secreted protein